MLLLPVDSYICTKLQNGRKEVGLFKEGIKSQEKKEAN
jgi:hypothetical protein